MPSDLLEHARKAKGLMPEDEGALLHRIALERLPHGPALEVGTYCGKSGIYLGAAAQQVTAATGTTAVVFTVDHHRGSEENQAGWEHHDASVVDPELGLMDTLGQFRKNIARAGLEEHTLWRFERGTTMPSVLALVQLAAVLECRPGDLLQGVSASHGDGAAARES